MKEWWKARPVKFKRFAYVVAGIVVLVIANEIYQYIRYGFS